MEGGRRRGTGTRRIGIRPKRQLPFQLEMQRSVTFYIRGGWLHFAMYSDLTVSQNLIPLRRYDFAHIFHPLRRDLQTSTSVCLFSSFVFLLFSFVCSSLSRAKTSRISRFKNGRAATEEGNEGVSRTTVKKIFSFLSFGKPHLRFICSI